jgi:hypothetical protein
MVHFSQFPIFWDVWIPGKGDLRIKWIVGLTKPEFRRFLEDRIHRADIRPKERSTTFGYCCCSHFVKSAYSIDTFLSVLALNQGSQTRGPRAACVPPDAFVRPVSISKIDNKIYFDKI